MRRERGETVVDITSDVVSLPDAPPPEEVVDHIPHGVDWRYEPDWDGLRVTARLGPGVARLVSGRRRNFDPFFPEVVRSLSELDVGETIVEGSLIVVDARGLAFASVRRRLHPSSARVEWLAKSSPATLALGPGSSSASSARASPERATSTTPPPRALTPRATSAPIPRDAPVTMTVRPSRRKGSLTVGESTRRPR